MSYIFLESNTINKEFLIDKITLYDTALNKEIITISKFEAKTNLLNNIYNKMQESNIFIDTFYIKDVKRKLKPNYKEKDPFYTVIEHDTKYYNNYKVNLFLNQNYFEKLIIKENEIKKEMNPGDFYFYDKINFIFKNIDIYFKNYTCVFCKDYPETQTYNKNWDATKQLKDEIQKEKNFIKDYPELKKSNYLKVLQEKIKNGFNFITWYYKKDFKNNDIKIDIETFNHIEKNSYRIKLEKISSIITKQLYYSVSCNDVTKILKILNIDINNIDLKTLEAPEETKQNN